MIAINDRVVLDEREIDERFVRASGPGGQNVNKVATAVELRFDIRGSSLPDEVKARLLAKADSRLTDDGVLVIDSRVHRSQVKNREAARERLATIIRQAFVTPRSRRKTRPTKAAREDRLEHKKRRAVVKALRGRGGSDE